jgi:hypothetical protein
VIPGCRGILTMKEKFHHRLNADGTIDSICLSCFLTAARADIGSDLQELLAAHQCDNKEPFILSDTSMNRFLFLPGTLGMASALNATSSLVNIDPSQRNTRCRCWAE